MSHFLPQTGLSRDGHPLLLPLELRAVSYLRPQALLPALLESVRKRHCWLARQEVISSARMELRLEVPLRSAEDLYGELIRAGLELSRASHQRLAGLCTLRCHRSILGGRLVEVRLQVRFGEEAEHRPLAPPFPSA